MYCTSCGKETPANSKFCLHCGARTAVPDTSITSTPQSIQWEYQDFVWTHPLLQKGIAGRDMLETMRHEWWSECQSYIMTDLQKWLDEGWEPMNPIGPDNWDIKEVRESVAKHWSAVNWILFFIFLIPTAGLALLSLFQTDTVYKPVAFRVRMKRRIPYNEFAEPTEFRVTLLESSDIEDNRKLAKEKGKTGVYVAPNDDRLATIPLTRTSEGYSLSMMLMVLFAIYQGILILRTLILSFQRYDIISYAKFVGFDNYIQLFSDDASFRRAMLVTFSTIAIRVGIAIVIGWILAAALRQKLSIPIMLVLVAVMPLPFINSGGTAILWKLMGQENFGLLRNILAWTEPDSALLSLWLVDAFHTLAVSSSVGLVIYALIQKDGITERSFKVFSIARRIMLIVAAASGLQSFNWSYVITRGGPTDSTVTLLLKIYRDQFMYFRLGYGAACATILLIMSIVLTFILWKLIISTSLRVKSSDLIISQDSNVYKGLGRVLWILGMIPTIVILLPQIWYLFNPNLGGMPLIQPASYPWAIWLVNSIVPSLLAIWFVQLPIAIAIAYTIVERNLLARKFWRVLVQLFLLSGIISPSIISVPLFVDMRAIGWLDTAWSASLPLFFNGISVVLFMLCFDSVIPRLTQNRKHYKTNFAFFRSQVLPSIMPIILVMGIIETWWASQRLFWPVIVLASPQSSNISLGLLRATESAINSNPIRLIQVTTLPIAILFAIGLVLTTLMLLKRVALTIE